MESAIKNIIIVLTLLTLLFAAYYFYTQQPSVLNFSQNEADIQQMTSQAQVFIERGSIIQQVTIDTSLFSQLPFNQLRSFTSPVEPQQTGRPNPFLPTTVQTSIQN